MNHENKHEKVDRGGTTKYVLANLTVMMTVCIGIIFLMMKLIPGPWWQWIVLGPLAFLVAGFFEERILSKWVNLAVEKCFGVETKNEC